MAFGADVENLPPPESTGFAVAQAIAGHRQGRRFNAVFQHYG
jgi:hypothetical protein